MTATKGSFQQLKELRPVRHLFKEGLDVVIPKIDAVECCLFSPVFLKECERQTP